MIQIEFTEEEIGQLHHERLGHPHSKVRQRCEVVYLKALGFTHKEIGRIMRLSQPTVRSYLEMCQAGGLEKLKELNFYQPTSELDAHRDEIKVEFEFVFFQVRCFSRNCAEIVPLLLQHRMVSYQLICYHYRQEMVFADICRGQAKPSLLCIARRYR